MALTQVQGGMILPSTTLTTPIVATTMGVGGATPAASGSGITFPATQSASTDANTLDDYEEGSWTPTIIGATFSNQSWRSGRYVKIGKVVYINWDFSGDFSSIAGQANIGGLPFVPVTSINEGGYFTVQLRDSYALNTSSTNPITGWFSTDSEIRLEQTMRGPGGSVSWLAGSTLRCTGNGWYFTT